MLKLAIINKDINVNMVKQHKNPITLCILFNFKKIKGDTSKFIIQIQKKLDLSIIKFGIFILKFNSIVEKS